MIQNLRNLECHALRYSEATRVDQNHGFKADFRRIFSNIDQAFFSFPGFPPIGLQFGILKNIWSHTKF